ncbi:MAG: GPI inositol-deacylase [Balneolales bacterium]|nr:GPI inositol-deacylase [Balneolales bacterium]
MPKKTSINSEEIKALADLVKESTISITELTEEMNRRISNPPGISYGFVQRIVNGISSLVFRTIYRITHLVGLGVEKSIMQFGPSFDTKVSTEKKDIIISVLNGVLGDYLVKKKNPLAISMRFRYQGNAVQPEADVINSIYGQKVNGKILLLIHGLCMNDVQWTRKGINLGEEIATELDKTPIYLHYNSGLHISENGKSLNTVLESLIQNWPVPVTEIIIIGHSMGGLVARSAYFYGEKDESKWTSHLKKLIFLASPHHGAPLERLGNYVDLALDATFFTKPFARVGKIRSPGITDLRYGNIIDDDWADFDRFVKRKDERIHVPLPEKVNCYAVSALIGRSEGRRLKAQFIGDGLVTKDSALGFHNDPEKSLNFKYANTLTVFKTSHLDVLNSPLVLEQLLYWIKEDTDSRR